MALVQQEIMVSTFIDFTGGIHLQGNGTTNSSPASTAITFGSGTTGTGANSVSIGNTTTASGPSCISIGNGATTSGTQSTSLGTLATTGSDNDLSIGSNATCSGSGGSGSRIAIGVNTIAGAASQSFSICIGSASTATQSGSLALGRLASSTHTNSTALGINATTTAANQTVIGGSSNTQVLATVGTTGLLESTGFVVAFNQVRASIAPSATQNIASGASFTGILMATVVYASDYGSPSITSVASQIQTRANRNMAGYFVLAITFLAGAPVANSAVTVRIQKNTNGVINTITASTITVTTAIASYFISIPFMDYNQTAVTTGIFYFCECDNNAAIGRVAQVQTSSHFTASMTN